MDLVGVFETNSGFSGVAGASEATNDLHEGAHSINDLERILRERIIGRTARDTINKGFVAKAFALAGGKTRGSLSLEQMKTCFARWGIRPSEGLMAAAYSKWDKDGNGGLDVDEFMQLVLGDDFDLKHKSVYNRFTEEDCPTSSPIAMLNFQQGMIGRQPLRRKSIKSDIKNMQAHGCKLTQQMNTEKVVDLIRSKIFLLSNSNCAGRTAAIYKMVGRPSRGISPKALKQRLTMWGIHVTNEQLDQIFRQIGPTDSKGWVSFSDFMQYLGADAESESQEHPLGAIEQSSRPRSQSPTGMNYSGKQLIAGRFQSLNEWDEVQGGGRVGEMIVPGQDARRKVSQYTVHAGIMRVDAVAAQESDYWQHQGVDAVRQQAWSGGVDEDRYMHIHSAAERARREKADRDAHRLKSELSQSRRVFLANQMRPFSLTIPDSGSLKGSSSGGMVSPISIIKPDSLDQQFQHRLLHNLEKIVAAAGDAADGMISAADLTKPLGKHGLISAQRVSEKLFREVIRDHFSRPMAIPAHILNTAVANYRTHGVGVATEKGNSPVDVRRLYRDLQFMYAQQQQMQRQQPQRTQQKRQQQKRGFHPLLPEQNKLRSSDHERWVTEQRQRQQQGHSHQSMRRGSPNGSPPSPGGQQQQQEQQQQQRRRHATKQEQQQDHRPSSADGGARQQSDEFQNSTSTSSSNLASVHDPYRKTRRDLLRAKLDRTLLKKSSRSTWEA
jgi:Ca2+-binding EF-hand superfamily protein